MPHADFVHLRVHSAYSLSEGAIRIKELVNLCKAQAMPAVAVTDTGNLFGAMEFALAAAPAGVQPIVGCQLAVRREDAGGAHAQGNGVGLMPLPDQIVLLAQTELGYRNLMALVSHSYLDTGDGEAPQVALADLKELNEGLIALTAGPAGAAGRLLLDGQADAAQAMLEHLASLFPGRLYVELMRHGLDSENRIEEAQIDLAYRLGLPLVATNECFFADAGMYEAHDALLCIAQGRALSDGERRRVTPEHRLKTPAEMRALFADLPEALDNTLVIARRCAFMPRPVKPILPTFPEAGAEGEPAVLRRMAVEGLERRLERHVYPRFPETADRAAIARPYHERLDFELGVVVKMGFAGYFLIVADLIQWAKRQGIPVGPGRGSGAGSVVAWSLTITDLDPLRWGLLFERFLNPERVSMPDFDIDFCQDRRDEVIRYVQQRYGRDRVAQIITFGKLQARAVLRDVGRVMGMPYGQVDRLCKMVPNNPANPVTLAQAIEKEPALEQARDSDESVARLIDTAMKLEGLYRHASTHAGGVVIGDRPLEQLVALYRDPRSDMPVTQFNMKYVEQAGLVKFDFLGLKTLTVLDHAVRLVNARGGSLDLAAIPLDDPPTYAMLSRADTTGVFQYESGGFRDVLRRLKPDRFEDLIAIVALFRPGPMDDIPKYINVKQGAEPPDYMHPAVEPILKETYGVIVYQEQVQQIAQVLAGYSLGGADLLRRAMGKKIKAEMDAQRAVFMEGATRRNIDPAQASAVFDKMAKFAGYGFNKGHSAPYALIAYQTAYLKANHAVEFMAASMTLDRGNTDKLGIFRQELGRMGIKLLAPDINRSSWDFTVEDGPEGKPAIRYALAAIRNVGEKAMRELTAERANNGPFRSLFDLARRLDSKVLNKRMLESLAAAGAFDQVIANRAQVTAAADLVLRHANAAASERGSGQVSLFGDAGDLDRPPPLPAVAEWAPLERLAKEFDAIGFYLSAHPLDAYGKTLARLGVTPYAAIREQMRIQRSTRFTLAGIVAGRQERTSARGNRFAFVQLSDQSGLYEATAFSEVLSSAREMLVAGNAVLLTADAQLQGDDLRLTIQSVRPLDQAAATAAAGLMIFLRDQGPLKGLDGILKRDAKGRGTISLLLDLPDREVEMKLGGGFQITPQVRAALKALPGIVDVREV
ncbi:MAG: DNA polymerase III subunit alpha [Alphaproteobacteria bacterium]|nr:DNA polymerase III subunit alpha [Alphaproteobacteria bacterium]